MGNRWLATSVLAAAAVVGLAACGSSSSPSSTPSAASTPKANSAANSTTTVSATGIKLMSVGGRRVLTDAAGFVLYWFALDTPTASNCNGSCATYWPPVIGTPSLASGVSLSGKLGTIKRSDGQLQATYDGHPLYTFKSDTSAGMDSGNALDASGGLWWAMTASGAKIKAKGSSSSGSSGSTPTPSPSSSGSGSGGYGY
jgi:predicted lipoprotein with Yx(FWY)xxD motif